MDIYEPAEDSHLLEKWVKQKASGSCLDIGTGSGIQARAVRNAGCEPVVALDINPQAVAKLKDEQGIDAYYSDLFNIFEEDEMEKRVFETIIFNAPYLPQDEGIEDVALYGGKEGYETIVEFLKQAKPFLEPFGRILLLFSSHSNKKHIDKVIEELSYHATLLEKKHIFFEDMYCYEIKPVFAKGKRGIILLGKKEGELVAIKTKRESATIDRLFNEAEMLKKVNERGIGPKFISYEDGELAMEFIEGEFFEEWTKGKNSDRVKTVLKKVLEQCVTLDKMGINKEEMHRPIKHILMKGDEPVMIDFERAHHSEKTHNVTQFLQYLSGERMHALLPDIAIDRELAKDMAKKYLADEEIDLFESQKQN